MAEWGLRLGVLIVEAAGGALDLQHRPHLIHM